MELKVITESCDYMNEMSVNRNYSGYNNGIKKLDQTGDSQKTQENSINLGRFDTVDVKKPELLLNGIMGGLCSNASFGSGYVKGEQTLDDLKSQFQNEFESLFKANTDKCRTTLNNKEDIKAILDSVFKDDYFSVINNTLQVSVEKGKEFGKGVYYSADDYYMAGDMTNALKDAYNEICTKYGIEDTTLPDVPYKTYNDWWGQMASEKMAFDASKAGPPPEGFEMFYGNNPNEGKNIDKISFDEYSMIRQEGSSLVTESMNISFPKDTDIQQYIKKHHLQNLFSFDGQYIRPTSKGWDLLHKLTSGKDFSKDELPLNSAGKPIDDEVLQLFKDNTQNEDGRLSVRCGDWSMKQEIPFNFLTKNYFADGSAVAKSWDNQAVKDYFSNFTFRSNLSSLAYVQGESTPRLNQII